MNKKMIMLISALVWANNVAFAAQKGTMQAPVIEKVSSVAEPLTAEQDKVYQGLVAKFKAGKLNSQDNTVENIAILNQRKSFLQNEVVAHKQGTWKPWLASITGSLLGLVGVVGHEYEHRYVAELNEPHHAWFNRYYLVQGYQKPHDLMPNAAEKERLNQLYQLKEKIKAQEPQWYTTQYDTLAKVLVGIGLLSVPVIVYKFYGYYANSLKEKEIVMIDAIINQLEMLAQ